MFLVLDMQAMDFQAILNETAGTDWVILSKCRQLETEASNVAPIARHQYDLCGGKGGSAQAFARAVEIVRCKKVHSVQALLPVVQRLQAWDSVSTSVVEQGFARLHRLFGRWRGGTNEPTKFSAAKLILDVDLASPDWHEIVRQAQKIWLETWGPVRRSGADKRKETAACIASAVLSKNPKAGLKF